ncbi:hypothetical protein KCM76_01995 [Zooshikella marina]|uniref:hypothetical protein n=1 Tax=Zooshikella ganghwensis TaxID=202772 RepID=UPI001BB0CC68|nr:hypothetical protein [Zooshikella ganghwensis]MBU2704732.1 hypothetical protein [Zooshikella ganghwensis]
MNNRVESSHQNNTIKFVLIAVLFFSLGVMANDFYNQKVDLKSMYNEKIQEDKRRISETIILAKLLQDKRYDDVTESFDQIMYLRFSTVIGLSMPLNKATQECNSDNIKKLLDYYQKYNKELYKKSSKACSKDYISAK